MAQIVELCRHPGHLEDCRQALIEVHRLKSLLQHCIVEGLRRNWQQCRQILLAGLTSSALPSEDPTGRGDTTVPGDSLDCVCKQVVVLGYPLGITAIHEVFYEAFHKLVRFIIVHRCRLREASRPAADDVFQKVFMDLHQYFLKGAAVRGSLTTYIAQVSRNACVQAINEAKRNAVAPEGNDETCDYCSFIDILPPGMVECWEDLDRRLLRSKWGDFINRIILAQQCIEAYATDDKPSARHLSPAWQRLSQMSDEDVHRLCQEIRAAMAAQSLTERDVVYLLGQQINSGAIEPNQVPVAFAAAMGMNARQVRKQLEELTGLSKTAIYTRVSRLWSVLKPPKTGHK